MKNSWEIFFSTCRFAFLHFSFFFFRSSNSDECTVYGPINKEPEEKLRPWKYERKDSGVRKLLVI